MRAIILYSLILLSLTSRAQFPYGTALVPGSVTLRIEETHEQFCDGVLSEKTTSSESYSSQLNGWVYFTEEDIAMLKMFPPTKGIQGTRVDLNNFTKTLPEGADFFDGKDYKIPHFPLIMTTEMKHYGIDPCKSNLHGCESDFKAVLNKTESCKGTAMHHGIQEVTFHCSIVGIENCSKYFFFSFFSGGTFINNGTAEIPYIEGKYSELVPKIDEDGCHWEWEKDDMKNPAIVEIRPQEDSYSNKSSDDVDWIGSDGVYSKYEETDEGDGTIYKSRKEINLPRIDTAAFFRYIREKPSIQTFSASGSYFSTDIAGNRKDVTTIRYSINLTLGKKPGFTIEAENEEEYKKWMPGNSDYPETFKPVSFKAAFEDKEQADTIHYMLFGTSHLPGICNNFPILGDKPPKEEPDIYFAPQDKQTDGNIKILNDSEAVTTKKVNSAVIVVYSRDFGGHSYLKAYGFISGETAVCPYDDDYSIEIPNDQDGNHIADDWEKQMGVEGIDKLADKDKLPSGMADVGDGLTAFEEYRGFVCEKDVIASCDADHTLRSGKHVRTSPVCRDVFVYDADGLFAKYSAGVNPSECHWHYVSKDQLSLPPADQVSKVISTYNSYTPAAADTKSASAFLDAWNKKEFRRMNKNSPDTLRNNKQFAMYLLTSPLATNGGITIFHPSDATANVSPLKYGHLAVIPTYTVFKNIQSVAINGLIANSKNNLAAKYPADVIEKVLLTAYEAMIPHEMGHNLGLDHHVKGTLTVINTKTKVKTVLTVANMGAMIDSIQYNEVFHLDGKEYLITSPSSALSSFGVTECCMRYTIERELDFMDMKVLSKSLKYCRKGQKFINGNGKETEADDCFSKIKIRCVD